MSANVEAMVREGSSALKAGRKDEARALLMKAVELDQFHEEAWLWLSAVVETLEDQQTCLENVLAINPNNERAKQGIKYIDQQRGGSVPAAPPPPPPPKPASPPARARAQEMPSSVEWGAPEGAEAVPGTDSKKRAADLSPEEYDAWVDALNLPVSQAKQPTGASASSPFVMDDAPDLDDLRGSTSSPKKSAPAPASKSAPSKPAKPAPKPIEDDFDLDEVQETIAEIEDDEPVDPLFDEIPVKIKPTRMPGTVQRLPIPLIIGVVVLLLANVGAGFLLFQTLTGLFGAPATTN
jgi:hypothetical protein